MTVSGRQVVPGSGRNVASQGDSLDNPVLLTEVARNSVLGGPVVPETDVAGVPVVPNGVFGPDGMLVEESKQRITFIAVEFLDVRGEAGVDEEDLGPCLRMRANDGMLDRLERCERLPLPATFASPRTATKTITQPRTPTTAALADQISTVTTRSTAISGVALRRCSKK
jgi:hypothetical protein